MLLVEIIHVVTGIYIMLFTIRMFVKGRDAYFNPLFSGIYKATEPIMAQIHKIVYRKPHDLDKADFSVLIPILALVIIDGALSGIFLGIQIVGMILLRFISFVDNAYLFFVVLVLIFGFFYQFARFPANPFLRGAYRIMEPAYVAVGKMGKSFREHSGIVLFAIAFVIHFILCLILFSVLFMNIIAKAAESPHIIALMQLDHSIRTLLSLLIFFSYVVIGSALMSWVSPDPANPVVQLLHLMSEPLNRPFRKIVPLIGGIDISPVFTILALQIAAQLGLRALILFTSYQWPVRI